MGRDVIQIRNEIEEMDSNQLDEAVANIITKVTRQYPSYSTELDAAFKVVDVLIEDEHYFKLSYSPCVTQPQWVAELGGYYGRGPTRELAICRAALLAVISENEEEDGQDEQKA